MSPLDTFGVQEVFCEALAGVERIGPNRRLVFIITSPATDGSGSREQVAVLKLAPFSGRCVSGRAGDPQRRGPAVGSVGISIDGMGKLTT